jgi:hypothetical protein
MSLNCTLLKRRALVCASALSFTLIIGCGNMLTNSPVGPSTELGAMTGKVHGGNQPISGATVKLYAAGITGYGKGSTLLASTTTSTDGSGSFAFTQVAIQPGTLGSSYACPSSKSLIYLVSNGGDPLNNNGSNNNTAAVMMAALGQCGSAAGLFVNVNEVSTVASVTALAQYINPGTSTPASVTIGTNGNYTLATPPQAGTGLINAFATVPNLETLSTGVANTSVALTGTAATVSAVAMTVTPETAKINHIADILAACVNNANASATNCTTLFASATPPSPAVTSQPSATFSTAVDTLQAAYYMATNPTNSNSTNLANLYNLAAANTAFQPTLAAQPTDWTVGINYKSTSSCTGTGALGTFIFYPYLVAADASGNIWVLSNNATAAGANLSEVSPSGLPLACVLGGTLKAGEGLALDTKGNVWVAGHSGGGIQKVDPIALTATAWTDSGITPWALAADGSGNIFYTAGTSVREFTGAATAVAAAPSTVIGGATGATPNFMAIDGSGRIWVPETSTAGGIYEYYPDASGTAVGGYSSAGIDASGTPVFTYNNQGMIAIDNSGKIWLGESNSRNILSTITPTAPNGTATGTLSTAFAGGINSPRGVAVDGAGNVWVPNGVQQTGSGPQAVSEFDKNGNALSPTGGGGTVATTNGGFQKPTSVFPSTLRAVTIDPSGNVWMGTNATTGTSISEIVGAAVPVVTPLATQLANGTIATKP